MWSRYTRWKSRTCDFAPPPEVAEHLLKEGSRRKGHPHSLNIFAPASKLRIQFTTDERYREFLAPSIDGIVLGIPVKIASLEDVTRGKLWAYNDRRRRLSKRKKNELDLIRLGEAYPELRSLLPEELRQQFECE
jgi:hypothetical protein